MITHQIELEIPEGISGEEMKPVAMRHLADISLHANFDLLMKVEGNKVTFTTSPKVNAMF